MKGHFQTTPTVMDEHRITFAFFDEEKGSAISCQTSLRMNAALKLSEIQKLKHIELDGYWIKAFGHPPMVFCVESIKDLDSGSKN